MGYWDFGPELRLDWYGKLRSQHEFQCFRECIRELLKGLLPLKIDHLADHSMDPQIEYIR